MSLNNTKLIETTIQETKTYSIQKPNIQRLLDKSKVKDIVDFQLDFHKRNGFFNFSASGAINIHVLEGKYYLVDGQHRMEALETLYHAHAHNIPFYFLFVHVNTWEELEENYNMINKNTALPDFSCYQDVDKNIPEEVASFFQHEYPTIWSKTSRARRPHVFFNSFQEALAFICAKCDTIKTSEELKDCVMDYNNRCSKWHRTAFRNVNENVYIAAQEKSFFLGLFCCENEDYRYEWAKKIVEEATGVHIKKESSAQRKKKIPKKIKNDAWDRYIGKDVATAPCICCRTTMINAKDFVAGHIVSEREGGEVKVENILPVCAGCNSSMGTQNMDSFVQSHYPDNYNKYVARDYHEGGKGWGFF